MIFFSNFILVSLIYNYMKDIMFTRLPPSPSSPHIPVQSLSINIVRCCKITTCLLCVAQPSPYPPCTIHANHNAPFLFFPPLSLPSHPSSPVPFPLVLCFCCCFVPSVFFYSYTPYMSEIIWYLSFSIWLISLSIIPSSSIHVVANGRICFFYG